MVEKRVYEATIYDYKDNIVANVTSYTSEGNVIAKIECRCDKIININIPEAWFRGGYLVFPCINKYCTNKYIVGKNKYMEDYEVSRSMEMMRSLLGPDMVMKKKSQLRPLVTIE